MIDEKLFNIDLFNISLFNEINEKRDSFTPPNLLLDNDGTLLEDNDGEGLEDNV